MSKQAELKRSEDAAFEADDSRSFYDYFSDPNRYGQHISDVHRAGRHPIVVARAEQASGSYPDPALPEFNLQLLTRNAARGVFDLGPGARELSVRPGQMLLAASDTPTAYDFDVLSNDHRTDAPKAGILMTAVPVDLVARLAAERGIGLGDGLGRLHEGVLTDPALVRGMELLDPATGGPILDDASFVDAMAHGLIQRLLTLSRGPEAPAGAEPTAGPALSPAERRRVVQFIDERLDRPIGVGDLAQVLNRPISGLSGAFRAAFGQTPYAVILDRRIRRGRDLLQFGQMPIAEVALACGFSSQAHFTTAFRAAMGVTPAAYRRQLAG
jgi:AraC-like DNA-binding protein